MKKSVLLFLSVFFILVFTACRKDSREVVIIKDCTGAYLRFDNKDYKICNDQIVAPFKDGDKVKATFEKTGDCEAAKDRVVCMMLHESEGWIQVSKIKTTN